MSKKDTHINKLVKGAGTLILFGVYSYVITFLFKLIVARHYGSSEFGLFILAQTIFGISVLIAGLGIKESIVRYVPYYVTKKNKKALSGYVFFCFLLPTVFSLIIASVIFLFSGNIAEFFNFPAKFSVFLKLIAIVIPFSTMNGLIKKIFLAEHKPIHNAVSYHFIEITSLFVGSLFVIYLNCSIVYLILVLLASILLSAVYNIYTYKFKIRLPLIKAKVFFIKKWLYFSLPLFFTGVFAYVIAWSDNIIIGKLLDPSELGVYSVCYSLAIFLLFFQTSFSKLFVPLISVNYAKKKFENIKFLFEHSAAWTFGLTTPVFLVLVLFSKQILVFLYGPEFAPGSTALIIISAGALINISTGLSKEILLLYKKTKFIFLVNFCIALFNIIFNLLLIPFFGIVGAAAASALSISLQNIIFLWRANKFRKLCFNFKYNIKFLLAGIPSIIIAKLIFSILPNKLLAILFSGIAYLMLYVILLLIIKTPTKEDIRLLRMIGNKFRLNLRFIQKLCKRS